MTQKQKETNRSSVTAFYIASDDDGKHFTALVDGWSCENEPDRHLRGLVISIDDGQEVIIPFSQIRKFYNYMVESGL